MKDSDKPLFSIVTPSLNQGRFLEDNIKSVLAQDAGTFEHIVVDGGSNDETLSVLKNHEHLLWTSEPDRGMSHALNKGFDKVRGEIVGWLNSDDYYEPGVFKRIKILFDEHPEVAFIYGDAKQVDSRGKVTEVLKSVPCNPSDGFDSPEPFLKASPVVQPAGFFRATALRETGPIDEELHYVMDLDYWVRLQGKFRSLYTGETYANFRMHEESKTGGRRGMELAVEAARLWEKFYGEYPEARFMGFLAGRQWKKTGLNLRECYNELTRGLADRFGLEAPAERSYRRRVIGYAKLKKAAYLREEGMRGLAYFTLLGAFFGGLGDAELRSEAVARLKGPLRRVRQSMPCSLL